MPNHVKNELIIKGYGHDFKNCAQMFKDMKTGFTFDAIVMMPKSLDIEASSGGERGLACYREYLNKVIMCKIKNANRLAKIRKELRDEFGCSVKDWNLGKKYHENLLKYGFKDWYDWRWQFWGTKWDAYDKDMDIFNDKIVVTFSTAWETPLPIFDALYRMFPTLDISVRYADEDIGSNCGTWHNGDWSPIYSVAIGTPFACDLWGYDVEEFEDYDDDDE